MDFLKVGNWLHSSLASAIDDDDTSIVLVAGGGDAVCPTDDMGARVYPFELTLYDAALASPELDTAGREIVLVTASDDADTLTVTRAQDGTTASAHPAGELAGVFVNAAHLQELQEAIEDYSTLDGLTDVDTTGVTDGQGIAYDEATATWLPETFLTAETAHDLLSSRHGDTLAGAVARGDVLIGNATPKWSRLAFPATAPTGKVLMASATDVEWSANPLGTAAYDDSGDFAPAADGVTNGNSHDHSGGDGAAIPLAGMADLAANSLIGNNTGSAATPLALSAADAKTLLGNVYIGTTAVALDRASAGLTLAGLTLTTPDIGTPSAGTLTNCTGLPIASGVAGLADGVATFLAMPTDSNFADMFADAADKTGSGALVFATSPTLVTPTLGVATATSLNVGSPATPSTGYIYAKMFGAYVSGGYGQVKIGSWNDTPSNGSAFTLFRARGTYASPTYGSDADVIGNWYFNSLNTAGGEQAGAAVQVYLDGAPAAGYVPMGMQIKTYDAGGTYATRLQISGYGSVVCGRQAALSTSATDGFLYIPSCAGTPSGTPTSYTGKVALVYDSTNNKLYIYDGGWIQVALAA